MGSFTFTIIPWLNLPFRALKLKTIKTGPQLVFFNYCGSVLNDLVKKTNPIILHWTLLTGYDIRFNCCNATRPILNKAQEAAANSGNKTTRSLVSAIKVNLCLQYIKYLF